MYTDERRPHIAAAIHAAAATAAAPGVQGTASLSANVYWTLSPEGPIANLTKPLALPVPANWHVLHAYGRCEGTSGL